MYINRKQFDGDTGLKSTIKTSWLGEDATLQQFEYEADDWVLTTKHNGKDYQLAATVASDDVWSFNKDTILKFADSLKFK